MTVGGYAPPRMEPVPMAMLETRGAVIAADSAEFVLSSGQQVATPFSSDVCPESPGPDSYTTAINAGARPVWVAHPGSHRPLYGLLLFCHLPPGTTGPASRMHLVRIPQSYVDATEGGRVSVVYEPVTSEGGTSGGTCTNTCQHANDSECDDGGPGSQYAVCALGTDCNDCGPRNAGPVEVPAWILYLSQHPFPGARFGQTVPPPVAQASGAVAAATQPSAAQGPAAVAPPATGDGVIGVQVRGQGNELVIVEVFPNGGGSAAGLTRGDAILAIDGVPLGQIGAMDAAVGRLRGPPGSQVTLRVRRLSSGGEEDVVVTRQAMP